MNGPYEKHCESCGEAMVMVPREGRGWAAVDADTFTEGDEVYDPAAHVEHFLTCTKRR